MKIIIDTSSTFWKAFSLMALGTIIFGMSNISSEKAHEQMSSPTGNEPFIGEISMFGGNFAPRGWAICNGQLLRIQGNESLFSLLGTTYGGDGRTTFGLPDLRGRVAMGQGSAPGLGNFRLGQKGGAPIVQGITRRPVATAGISLQQVGVVTAQPSNLQPYQTINYIIALQGLFPSRN